MKINYDFTKIDAHKEPGTDLDSFPMAFVRENNSSDLNKLTGTNSLKHFYRNILFHCSPDPCDIGPKTGSISRPIKFKQETSF